MLSVKAPRKTVASQQVIIDVVTAQRDTLQFIVDDLRAQMLNIADVASTINKMQRPAYAMPQWQLDRKAAMDTAKAQPKHRQSLRA